MQSKESWKRLMGSRAAEFSEALSVHGVWPEECKVCKQVGRGMRGDFEAHVGGPFHFKDLGRVGLLDGVLVWESCKQLWQGLCVPGGAFRFNHADGVIEIWKGSPPSELEEPGPSGEGLAGADSVNVGTLALVPLATPPPGDLPLVDSMPTEGEWYTVLDYIGQPTRKNGDAKSCPFFSSRNAWKVAMASPPQKVANLLHKYNVWPECSICDRSLGFEDHVPAAKHFDTLCSGLRDGVPVSDIAASHWQRWEVPGGAIRFNHIHGRIQLWRGPPPMGPDGDQPVSRTNLAAPATQRPGLLPSAPAASAPYTGVSGVVDIRTLPKPQPPPRFETRPHAGPPTVAALPEDGVWFQIRGPVAVATRQGGDWHSYPHLGSKSQWKMTMTPPAEWVCEFLERVPGGPIYPECRICERSRGFQEHVGAAAHLKVLADKHLVTGVPVEHVREALWHEWQFRGGALRFNYADGAVELCRGSPPVLEAAEGNSSALVSMPLQPPQLQPQWYSINQAASPPPPPFEPPMPPPAPPIPSREAAPELVRSQACSSDSSLAAVAQDAAASTAALCFWLWHEKYKDEAWEVEKQLLEAEVPNDRMACQLCSGRSMLGKIASHLLSPEHVRHVAAAAGLDPLQMRSSPEKHLAREELQQSWDTPGGRVTLHHLTLGVTWSRSSPAASPSQSWTRESWEEPAAGG